MPRRDVELRVLPGAVTTVSVSFGLMPSGTPASTCCFKIADRLIRQRLGVERHSPGRFWMLQNADEQALVPFALLDDRVLVAFQDGFMVSAASPAETSGSLSVFCEWQTVQCLRMSGRMSCQ